MKKDMKKDSKMTLLPLKATIRRHIQVELIKTRAGILNKGNTCFVNSIVQCLVSLSVFSPSFFSLDLIKPALNPSSSTLGLVALSFSHFSDQLLLLNSPFNPTSFLKVLYSKCSLFDQRDQADAQEFLNWLLDSIHEDLNRIHKKYYLDLADFDASTADNIIADYYWDAFKKRDNSIITDTFYGQYKSRVDCSKCSLVSPF